LILFEYAYVHVIFIIKIVNLHKHVIVD